MISRMHSVHLIQLDDLPFVSLQETRRRSMIHLTCVVCGRFNAYRVLDMGSYGSSDDINNGETGVEPMDHGRSIEEVGVSSPGQEPERVQHREEQERVQVYGQGEKRMAQICNQLGSHPTLTRNDLWEAAE